MQAMTNALTLLTFSVCLGACSPGVPEILPPASSVTRREALETSRAYTDMAWKGSSRNVRHGEDPDGIRIDTPDADASGGHAGTWWRPGKRSTGMPYKWGGFDTPRQFAARLKADAGGGGAPAAAGDMGTPETWERRKSRRRGMPPSAALPPGWTAPASSPAAGAWTGPFPRGSFRPFPGPCRGRNSARGIS